MVQGLGSRGVGVREKSSGVGFQVLGFRLHSIELALAFLRARRLEFHTSTSWSFCHYLKRFPRVSQAFEVAQTVQGEPHVGRRALLIVTSNTRWGSKTTRNANERGTLGGST
jgi:hypothetical protein